MSQTSSDAKHAERGAPSYVWRFGQQRRLAMIRRWSPPELEMILVDGCGLGQYAAHLLEDSPHVYAFDIELERVQVAQQHVPNAHVAASEYKPYPPNTFDLILSNEVIEHVQDDGLALRDMARLLKPGGRIVLFCPNRWYPFETHGHYFRGEYHFGNTPLINYLPNGLRNRLAPHVRAYTRRDLLTLIRPLPLKIIHSTRIFGGYDNITTRFPSLGKALRAVLYGFEQTPLRVFGLSHLMVLEKTTAPAKIDPDPH
ncbi:MAG: methyltransferase domain-containing protein [Chloroflexi bacterium]|nr:methyltransferase domain-containing protein [Chloroflexota bacterium]